MSIDLVFVLKWLKSVISLWGVYKTTTEMILQTICLVLSNVLIKQSGKDAVMGCDAIPIHHVQTFFYQLYFNCEYEKKIRPKICHFLRFLLRHKFSRNKIFEELNFIADY